MDLNNVLKFDYIDKKENIQSQANEAKVHGQKQHGQL